MWMLVCGWGELSHVRDSYKEEEQTRPLAIWGISSIQLNFIVNFWKFVLFACIHRIHWYSIHSYKTQV